MGIVPSPQFDALESESVFQGNLSLPFSCLSGTSDEMFRELGLLGCSLGDPCLDLPSGSGSHLVSEKDALLRRYVLALLPTPNPSSFTSGPTRRRSTSGQEMMELAVPTEFLPWPSVPSPRVLHEFLLKFKEPLPLSLATGPIFSSKLDPPWDSRNLEIPRSLSDPSWEWGKIHRRKHGRAASGLRELWPPGSEN